MYLKQGVDLAQIGIHSRRILFIEHLATKLGMINPISLIKFAGILQIEFNAFIGMFKQASMISTGILTIISKQITGKFVKSFAHFPQLFIQVFKQVNGIVNILKIVLLKH